MRTEFIVEYLKGYSQMQIGRKRGITNSSVSYAIKTAMDNVKNSKIIKSNSVLSNKLRRDITARDIDVNKKAWKEAMTLLNNENNVKYLEPVTTIFKVDDYKKAFEITKKQDSTLSAYEGALLMYNTIVANHNIIKK
jgi:DNA-directed RNA polymerase specialized sigma subunit